MTVSRWIHRDDDLSARLERGSARASSRDWQSGSLPARAAELQALTVETSYQIARLIGRTETVKSPQELTSVLIEIPEDTDAPEYRQAAAGRLYSTLYLLARPTPPSSDVETMAPPEAGALPALAVVAIVVCAGAAVAYVGHEAARVIDRELSRKEQTRRMVEKHAAALQVIAAHTERELREEKSLPLDAASKQVLSDLHSEQLELAKQQEEPFGNFLPAQVHAGAGVASWLTPLVVAVGAVGVGYLYLKG